MPIRSARVLFSPLRSCLAGLVWLIPLLAHAEDHDPAEIGHAIWFLGFFALFFITTMSFAIWLLIVRLRSRDSGPDIAPQYPNLEGVLTRDPLPAGAAAAVGSPAQPGDGSAGHGS